MIPNNTTVSVDLDGLAVGRSSTNPFITVFETRNPTSGDVNYLVQQRWVNFINQTEWILESFTRVQEQITANWVQLIPNGLTPIGEVNVDAHTSPGTNPVIATDAGAITVTGGQVAAGTTTHVIQTDSLAANTYTIQVQRSQAAASSTIGDNGVCHFSNTDFGVDANGFVTLAGGAVVTNFIPDSGTSPVVPSAAGAVTMHGSGGLTVVGGLNELTFEPNGTIATTYDADSGSATPSGGVLHLSGGTGISTSATGSTVTFTNTYTPGVLVQYKFYSDAGAYFSTTSTFAYTNTAPSNTDGAAFMSGAITPLASTNRLIVRFQTAAFINVGSDNAVGAWILRDAATSAAATRVCAAGEIDIAQICLVYEVVAGSTSATTFYVRVGTQAAGGGKMEINGSSGSALFDLTSISTLEIMEFTP